MASSRTAFGGRGADPQQVSLRTRGIHHPSWSFIAAHRVNSSYLPYLPYLYNSMYAPFLPYILALYIGAVHGTDVVGKLPDVSMVCPRAIFMFSTFVSVTDFACSTLYTYLLQPHRPTIFVSRCFLLIRHAPSRPWDRCTRAQLRRRVHANPVLNSWNKTRCERRSCFVVSVFCCASAPHRGIDESQVLSIVRRNVPQP